ncbi:hypothetical protein J7M28_12845 [bacterium]|nr:hypothetical protein [bacterium]
MAAIDEGEKKSESSNHLRFRLKYLASMNEILQKKALTHLKKEKPKPTSWDNALKRLTRP